MAYRAQYSMVILLGLLGHYNLMGKPFPISFSISETKIINYIPHKDRDFAFIIPGDLRTYIYEYEADYYKDYQRSCYAITQKKGGWDCLRHYEILANGCIPYFIDIEHCPENTMHLLPKKLIHEAMHLRGVSRGHINHAIFDKKRYYEILHELLEYTRTYLTNRSMAQYLLDTIGYSGSGKILFLSNESRINYLIDCTLTGLKQIVPENIIDVPKLNHIYKSYPHDIRRLYGKGFSCTRIVEDIPVDRSNIEARIRNKEFEFIIYSHTHYGRMFYETVIKYYPPEKIVYMDGEDEHRKCEFAHLKNYFLREYNAVEG